MTELQQEAAVKLEECRRYCRIIKIGENLTFAGASLVFPWFKLIKIGYEALNIETAQDKYMAELEKVISGERFDMPDEPISDPVDYCFAS